MDPYRPCAGILLFNRQGQVWVGERLDTPGAWQPPQGGIDAGETPCAAARRELREEIGSDHAVLLAESRAWLRYDLPDRLRGQVWGGRYRGQAQKWFAFRYLGADDEINIVTEKPEFQAWRWVPLRLLPDLAIDFKRAVYEALTHEFAAYAKPVETAS